MSLMMLIAAVASKVASLEPGTTCEIKGKRLAINAKKFKLSPPMITQGGLMVAPSSMVHAAIRQTGQTTR